MRLMAILSVGVAVLGVGCPNGNTPESPPPTPVSGIKVVNMIPASLSGETNQDSEPFLAVHPRDRQRMAGSAFTPSPAGPTSPTAPIFITSDGGDTWSLIDTVPSASLTGDITHAFDGEGGKLFAGILQKPLGLQLEALVALDFLMPDPMVVQATRPRVDQPFVQVHTVASKDRVYLGLNDLAAAGGKTATVDVSTDGGSTYHSARVETRDTFSQDGPSVRPTVARDATVYVAYFGWRAFDGSIATSDVVVVRDDHGATGSSPFGDLKDPTDGKPGRLVAKSVKIPWSNEPTLGHERIGSTLSIAADPNHSDTVYVGWGDRTGSDVYTLHVRRSADRGATWSADLRTLHNATNVALCVADNGTVGLLYQQFRESGAVAQWVTHLDQSTDGFATSQDIVLASVPANTPDPIFLPYLGDYNYLLRAGNEFRGIFSANNTPDKSHFPQGVRYQRSVDFTSATLKDGDGATVSVSIDPFYFSVPVR